MAWSQKDLAEAAGVSISTLAEFERDLRIPHGPNLAALARALVEAGIELIPADDVSTIEQPKGAGVRFSRL